MELEGAAASEDPGLEDFCYILLSDEMILHLEVC